MNTKLTQVTKTLHQLIRSLPAVRSHCSEEVLRRHMQLIAYFQHQHDLLIATSPA